ncbi:hypothetical protein BGZ49_000436 [Haplosporangium sp. Z 27]|nr:hypothetical protein BGZ49_000436 [Haplosporangium sp. Z 27]
MAMAIVQPDAFSSPNSTPVEELLQSTAFNLNQSNGNYGNSGSSSSSSSTSPEDIGEPKNAEDCPILTRLLSYRDLFPMILGYLDTRSLLSLTMISQRFHREILTPATPNLCYLNLYLQQRTVVCPMAQFESLKDFMVKYRSFKPLHLHFTYSERSSLMSLEPEITAPIYNSKQDTSFIHPISSPLSASDPYKVNQSISISSNGANSLYQLHHSSDEDQQPLTTQTQLQRQLMQTQLESDRSLVSTDTFITNVDAFTPTLSTSTNATPNTTSASQPTAIESVRNSSNSNSTNSAINDEGSVQGSKSISKMESKHDVVESKSPVCDLDSKVAAMTINTPDSSLESNSDQDLQQHQQQKQQQQQKQNLKQKQVQYQRPLLQQQHDPKHFSSLSADYRDTSSNISDFASINSYNQLRPNGGPSNHSSSSKVSELIPVHLGSSASTSRSNSGKHEFELSYWQKFALNELFMRLLPFLKTITIGRTDKPSRRARLRDSTVASNDLSPGVCFFLARCFNVMHDMPDTALESVIWMDVTPKDVALLVAMIGLRDIMVDGRYWKRGYWAKEGALTHSDEDSYDNDDDEDEDDDDDWDGFYYLINQEGEDSKPKPPLSSASAGKAPQRKLSSIKGASKSSSPSIPKQTITPVSSSQQQVLKNGSTLSSNVPSSSHPQSSNVNGYRVNSIEPPAPWQGFGDGVNTADNNLTVLPEHQIHPAVLMYERLKAEITDAALISRTLDKGKHT